MPVTSDYGISLMLTTLPYMPDDALMISMLSYHAAVYAIATPTPRRFSHDSSISSKEALERDASLPEVSPRTFLQPHLFTRDAPSRLGAISKMIAGDICRCRYERLIGSLDDIRRAALGLPISAMMRFAG